ncbi:hypothetical protein HER10_EVM0008716 [Colletotrichum scovillei]|uniref:Uncharacterized protein n=1 Tax=Colletotrichum scovillei TaxID=1209932 RepID=A0A9P7QVU3_9PEZI|nr:uncharacterized protein HER10_EVM0008716 [Colletotrichum scovillei]KAF4784468.1 hypothetical protein HER10_EVM0008716 [Colletotrichum scovillei]KAG7044345.1 hypothetical protein JMJ77_0003808 [Colletotrichum scovillei]KAG7049053.1 hypothetical protein JMJ78_0013037 [Colletotrichum scovillei]KAG7063798.1 hypothetical protein JMJ76_0006847 [Colletotrichum scovillei]
MVDQVRQRAEQTAAPNRETAAMLEAVSGTDARKVLFALCREDERVRRRAVDLLQKMPRTDVCANCKEKFDVNRNAPDACRYHPGDFELDEDLEVWGTIDEVEEFYEMDSEEARADVPEGFRWSCCQRVGEVECCQKGQHVAVLEHAPLTLGSLGESNNGAEVLGEQSHGKRKAEEDIVGTAQKTRTGSRRI